MSSATQLLEFRGPKIYAMYGLGKFVEVYDTNAEGRLVLAGEYHFNCFLSGTLKLALTRVALCFDRAKVAYSHLRCHSHWVYSSPEPSHFHLLYFFLIGQWILHWVRYTPVSSVTMVADNRHIVKQMVDLRYPLEPT